MRTVLADLLDRQIREIQRLTALLERERSAIADRDAATLEDLAAEKLTVLATTEHVEHQCRECLTAAGYADDAGGMAEAVRQSGSADLAERWQSLRSRLGTLRRANERNGISIQRSLGLMEDELMLLRGGTGSADVYAADGHRTATDRSRPLTRA